MFIRKNIFLGMNISIIVLVFGFSFFSFTSVVKAGPNDCSDSGNKCVGSVGCGSTHERKPDGDLSCPATTPWCCQLKIATCDLPSVCKVLSNSNCPGLNEVNQGQKNCPTGQACCTPPITAPTTVPCNGTDESCKNTCAPTEDLVGVCVGAASRVCCKPKPVCALPNGCIAGGACPGGATPAGTCSSGQVCCAPAGATPIACSATGQTCRASCNTGEASIGICSSGLKCCSVPGVAGVTQTIPFTNPLAFDTVEGLLGSILGTLQKIIVVLALVFIVIGAVIYITSAGNEGQMTLAKGAITAAMIGLAIGIAAPSFLKEIYGVLGGNLCAGLTGQQLLDCQNSIGAITGSGTLTLTQIAMNVLNFLLSIVGILGIIMLVVGGIMYLTAAGDEDRIDTGKKIVTYAIIGILIALAALIIVKQIATFFGP